MRISDWSSDVCSSDLLNGRIAPVKIRLLLQEGVVIILFGSLVPFPGRAAEIADPVIGRSAAGSRIAPDVPVATRIVPRRSALNKPGVPVRAEIGRASCRERGCQYV